MVSVKFLMSVSKGTCSRSGLKVICGFMRVLDPKKSDCCEILL